MDIGEDENPEEVLAELKARIVEIGARFNEEADIREEDPFEQQEEDEAEKWDCESILSTYTNTDNHPGVIKTTRRIRPS